MCAAHMAPHHTVFVYWTYTTALSDLTTSFCECLTASHNPPSRPGLAGVCVCLKWGGHQVALWTKLADFDTPCSSVPALEDLMLWRCVAGSTPSMWTAVEHPVVTYVGYMKV